MTTKEIIDLFYDEMLKETLVLYNVANACKAYKVKKFRQKLLVIAH